MPKSSWRSVNSKIFQESILGLVPLSILINYLNNGVECTVSKSVFGIKLWVVADSPKARGALHRDLDRTGRGNGHNQEHRKLHQEAFHYCNLQKLLGLGPGQPVLGGPI